MKLSKKKELFFLLTFALAYLLLMFLPFNFTYDESLLFLFSNTFVLNKISETRFFVFDLVCFLYLLIIICYAFLSYFGKNKFSTMISILGFFLSLVELIFYVVIISRDSSGNYYNNIDIGFNEHSLIMYVINLGVFVFLFIYSIRHNFEDLFIVLFIVTIFMLLVPSVGLSSSYKNDIGSGGSPYFIYGLSYKFNFFFLILALSILSHYVSILKKNRLAIRITSIAFLISSLLLFGYNIYETKPLVVNMIRTIDMYTRSQIFYSILFVLISIFELVSNFKKKQLPSNNY